MSLKWRGFLLYSNFIMRLAHVMLARYYSEVTPGHRSDLSRASLMDCGATAPEGHRWALAIVQKGTVAVSTAVGTDRWIKLF